MGDGDIKTPGQTNRTRVGLVDTFATLAAILQADLPDLRAGEKGAEDSRSVLSAWKGKTLTYSNPIFHNDHNNGKEDRAACAIRVDDPVVNDRVVKGKWKLFCSGRLIRFGKSLPTELYNLSVDPREERNLIDAPELQPLVQHLAKIGQDYRNSGGIRFDQIALESPVLFDLRQSFEPNTTVTRTASGVQLTIRAVSDNEGAILTTTRGGIGVQDPTARSQFGYVDGNETLELTFDQDVLIQSVAIEAGTGSCGGYYQMGDKAALAIYCIDADNDAKDQEGNLSDLGVLPAGQPSH